MREGGQRPLTVGRGEPARWHWRQACLPGRRRLAALVDPAGPGGGLDRDAYLRWLGMEATLARANGDAVAALVGDYRLSGPVRGILAAWQDGLQELVQLAHADLRRAGLGRIADPMVAASWTQTLAAQAGAAQADTVGMVAASLTRVRDDAGVALARLLEQDFVALRISTCLSRWREVADAVERDCMGLLDTRLAPGMVRGAERMACAYDVLYDAVFPCLQRATPCTEIEAHPSTAMAAVEPQ